MNDAPQILIVDDDPQICSLLQDFLSKHNYRVVTARDGREMKRRLKDYNLDLIVLDIMLPGDDGLALCRKLREQSGIPIIMLSAVGEEADRIVGLEMGADDYLAKPFSPRELLARIKALLRRSQGRLEEHAGTTAGKAAQPLIQFSSWMLDQNKRRLVAADGLAVPLSAGEYDLLLAFVSHPKHTLSREQLLDFTHGRQAGPFDRTIDVQVGRLRKKLEEDPKDPKIIITVRGGGYQFTPEVNFDSNT